MLHKCKIALHRWLMKQLRIDVNLKMSDGTALDMALLLRPLVIVAVESSLVAELMAKAYP